jgi:hypothetical protein
VATTPRSVHQGTVAHSKRAPDWLPEAEEALRKLLSLPQNWNSYGALPIQPQNVQSAIQLLEKLVRSDTPRPIVTPTVRGGVQLEWHTRGIDLEIEIDPPGHYQVLFEDPKADVLLELVLDASDLARLQELLAQFSPPA